MDRTSDVRFSRWWLVAVAAVAMGAAGTYQFAWSSIRIPLGTRLAAPEVALGTVFTLFVVLQTVSQFPAGWVRDRFGPRIPTAVGALSLVAGYAGTAWAPTIEYVYLFYGIAGVGAGTIYTVAINTPVKWFDERRGLATGVVGLAYAGLSFVLIPFVRESVADDFGRTMLGLAALVGVLTLAAVPFLRDPADEDADAGEVGSDGGTVREDADAAVAPDAGEYTWREAVRTWQFWLLYAVFVAVNGAGLMVIAKVVAFAEAMALPAAATVAASLVALGDGAGVLVGGTASDRFGRERTITVSLVVCGVCLAGAAAAAVEGRSMAFVGLVTAAAFFRSPVFAVVPSLVGDYYGTSHSSENYAVLYSSKLWGGVGGGTVASALVVRLGWDSTFFLAAILVVLAGFGTYFLRPVDSDRS
ncbi:MULTISPECIES: MFS transporter [Halorussus]|uniref:MFS transporter n=1 Tax=Halorussus TaxID=1070314 RepID=UPI0020A0165B|nr:MFS transporter [Halorussus vallis]USZ75027.1 MFS transporter [Halorussus vallis]